MSYESHFWHPCQSFSVLLSYHSWQNNVLFKEKVPRDPGYTWLAIVTVNVTSFLQKRWNTAVSAFVRVGAIAEPRFWLRADCRRGLEEKQPDDAGRCGKQVVEKSAKYFYSSVEGISLGVSAGFEAVNKLPVFLLGNNFSVYAEILLFNACFCKTLLKWFKLLSFLSLSHWGWQSHWLIVMHSWGNVVLLRSKTERRQEIGHEGMKM